MMTDKPTYPWRRPVVPAGLAEAAIALGLPVFPCKADKSPLTPRGFKDASADPAVIRRMFSVPGAKLIGAPTGAASGVVVVDIDIKDGARGMEWLNANSERLPFTRTHKTRSGGLHLLFLAPVGVHLRNSASRVAPGVDVRGEGGYIIVPPSDGYQVADPCDPADMPDWLIAACAEQRAPASGPTPYKPIAIDADGTAYGRAALEDACGNIANAPDGAKHEILNREAYAIGGLVTAGEIPDGTAWAGLSAALTVLRPRCRDFRAAHKTLEQAYRDGKGRPREVEHTVVVEEEEEGGPHPAQALLDKLAGKVAQKQAKPLAVSSSIMNVEGVLKLIVDEAIRTAIRPQPFLALGAAICAVGVLAGRKYRTNTDLRTNIYVAGLAESGGGKDHAIEVVRRAIDVADLGHYMGGESIASGRAVLSSVEAHPARLFQIDELGYFLSTVTGPKAPSHKAEIWSELLKLYSRAKGIYRGTEYANRKENPRIDINQPCVCFYGTSTPATFWKALEGGALIDGSLARFLVFRAENDRPDRNKQAGIFKPSDELLEGLRTIAGGVGERVQGGNLPQAHVARMTATDDAEAYIVTMTPGATKRREKNQDLEDEWAESVMGTPFASIINRLCENAEKLALVRAVSRKPERPEITELDMAWGWDLSAHCASSLMREGGHHIADTEFESRCNKALAIVRAAGSCTVRDLFRRGLKLPARETRDLLDTLVQAGMLTVSQAKPNGAGRPTTIYTAAQDHAATELRHGDTID